MRRFPVIAGFCLLLGLALASTASARPLEKAIWGPSLFHAGHQECNGGPPGPCSAFPVYDQLGADHYQFQIEWNEVAPTRPANPRDPDDPAYDWPDVDFIVSEAGDRGIGLMALVKSTPGWANGGRGPAWAPNKPNTYADFMFAASRRYPTIHRWMIWGEPSRATNWRPQSRSGAPRRYARLLDAAFVALNQVRKSNIVIGGNTFNGGDVKTPAFLKNMKLPNGKPPRMDWYGHNPFDRRFPRIKDGPIGAFRGLNDIDTLWKDLGRAYAKRKAARPKKLWLSEWLILSDRPSSVFGGWFVSRPQQAKRLRAGYKLARSQKYVRGLGWYRLDDYPAAPDNPAWGLMTYSGARKPAYKAYRSVR